MSRSPTKDIPNVGVFEALVGLIDQLETMPEFADDRIASSVWRLRVAMRAEQKRTTERLPSIAWAQEGIELMKSGGQVLPTHIRAITECAEWAIAEQRNADARAVVSTAARDLLERCESELRDAASAYAAEPDPNGDGYRSCSSLAGEIEDFLKPKGAATGAHKPFTSISKGGVQ